MTEDQLLAFLQDNKDDIAASVKAKAIEAMKKFAAQGLTDPAAVDKGLNAAGLIAQASVKNRIRNGVGFAPLSEKTLAQRKAQGKSGTKPLIRTGQLLNSITYVVKE